MEIKINNTKELNDNELRKVQTDILSIVADYCDKNKIKYFLAYGTLLGAVRHKGYIPWDDDIDISMPRPDYEMFVNNFNQDVKDCCVYSQDNNPDYPWTFAKVSFENTFIRENTDMTFEKMGVNIDIFPIDGLPVDVMQQRNIIKSIKWQRSLLGIKSISLNKNRRYYKNVILLSGKIVLRLLDYKAIIKRINDKAKSYSYDNSNHVACLVWGYGDREITRKEYFDSTTIMEFEGRNFNAPAGYHELLTGLYGDYMQLPPEEERVTHHCFKAYWKT